MSFVNLATLTMHRRAEMEARIKTLFSKCDVAVHDIRKLKLQAKGFLQKLNCAPAELKEQFLTCMKQLDEYIYLISDFNLAIENLGDKLDDTHIPEQDIEPMIPQRTYQLDNNILDMLSEPTPSTSSACSNKCPKRILKPKKIPKEEQVLIKFSSSEGSTESVPDAETIEKNKTQLENNVMKEVKKSFDSDIQNDRAEQVNRVTNKPTVLSVKQDILPAQSLLESDHFYSGVILNVDGPTLWIVTDDLDETYRYFTKITDYYKNPINRVCLRPEEVESMAYCAFYDEDTNSYYRALLIGKELDVNNTVDIFLVDTGEVRTGPINYIQPLVAQFYVQPPYARCCHLAGVEPTPVFEDDDLAAKQEAFLKEFMGEYVTIQIDDNSSESLAVYVTLSSSKQTINDLMVENGLAVSIDSPKPSADREEPELDVTESPEYENPLEAVTGYNSRDEAEICKNYKGGPEKTCFKGSRCHKKHVLHHPDGWTRDQIEVSARFKTLPMPAPDSWLKVHISYVGHFDRIYVQLVREKAPNEAVSNFGEVLPPASLTSLVQDMNSPATVTAYKPLKMSPAPGEIVAALYPMDERWYRARVISLSRTEQSVEVMYVDYGNTMWVKENAIRALDLRFTVLPAQAILCRLAGVVAQTHCSKQWALAKKALSDMVLGLTLSAHVIARDYDELTIDLYDSDNYNVAEQLAVRNLIKLQDFTVVNDANVTHKLVVP